MGPIAGPTDFVESRNARERPKEEWSSLRGAGVKQGLRNGFVIGISGRRDPMATRVVKEKRTETTDILTPLRRHHFPERPLGSATSASGPNEATVISPTRAEPDETSRPLGSDGIRDSVVNGVQ